MLSHLCYFVKLRTNPPSINRGKNRQENFTKPRKYILITQTRHQQHPGMRWQCDLVAIHMEINPRMGRGDDLAGFGEVDVLLGAGKIDENVGALTAK